VCKKRFYETPINVHGSLKYIKHTNFSNNIGVMFARAKDVHGNKEVDVIVNEFFTDGNEKVNKEDAIEFLECFKHYKHQDSELLEEAFKKIQSKIDNMK